MNYKMDFISGDTKKCLLAVSLPMMIAMFLNMAYNLVDSLWIGNLMGETAYAALTNSTPLILILNSIAMGATNGISILLSDPKFHSDGSYQWNFNPFVTSSRCQR